MLPFALLSLLLHATSASLTTTTSAHYSEVLKIRCEALPFRSVYRETNCYFVIDVDSDGPLKQCSNVLAGSKFTGNAPDAVWRSLFVDKSKFMQDTDSKGAKKAMCMYEGKFKCLTGSTTSIPGVCLHRGDGKMNYREADRFCERVGSLPSPKNDRENKIIAAASKSAVWLHPSYSKTWSDKTDFSRFGTCAASPFTAASDPKFCSSKVAIAANPNAASGYWALTDQSNLLDVLCIGDATSEFWTAKPKPVKIVKKDCIAHHVWDDKTSRCEWSGPPDACVQIFHNDDKTQYVRIPSYPNTTTPGVKVQFVTTSGANDVRAFEDRTTRAVVRRGCMATFWKHREFDLRAEMKLLRNVEYGDYFLPNAANGALENPRTFGNGLSTVTCFCDPYDTERELPGKTECVEHHEWDRVKQRCVWKLEDNIAGEIESSAGKKLMLEIPNWPYNKRYDVNFNYANLPDFLNKVTRIIVRQGCFCTLYSSPLLYQAPQTRSTVNYGSHQVNGKSLRVVCECMNDDSGEERLIRNPQAPKCIDMHAYNEQTKRCEWTGPEYGCAKLTNTQNLTIILELDKCGKEPCVQGVTRFYKHKENSLSSAAMKLWDKQLTGITVRRGCKVDVYVAEQLTENPDVTYSEYKIITNAKYGTYRVPQKMFGDVEAGYVNHLAGNQVNCVCDQSLMAMTKAPSTTPCLEGHAYDQQTGQCEWTRDKRICAVISNEAGQTIDVRIENWPLEASKSWHITQSKEVVKNATLFVNRVTSVLVRQHCFVSMYLWAPITKDITLSVSGYGVHKPKKDTGRVVCGCMA